MLICNCSLTLALLSCPCSAIWTASHFGLFILRYSKDWVQLFCALKLWSSCIYVAKHCEMLEGKYVLVLSMQRDCWRLALFLTTTLVLTSYRIVENENFSEFRGFVAIRKSFLHEIAGVASVGGTSKQSVKVFSMKIVFSTKSRKFSLSKVFRYTVYGRSLMWYTCSGTIEVVLPSTLSNFSNGF